MSIWTRPLFRRSAIHKPGSEIGRRVQRISMAGSFGALSIVMCGYCCGAAVVLVELIVVLGAASPLRGVSWPAGIRAFIDGLVRDAGPGLIILPFAMIVLVASFMPRFHRWTFDRTHANASNEQLARWRRRRRGSPRFFRWVYAAIATPYIAFAALSGWAPALMLASKVAASFGGAIITLGLFGRRGTTLVCARCNYPMCTWRGAPDQCPECGSRWRDPWGARFGQRGRRPKWIAAGIAMIAASVVLMTIVGIRGFGGY